ncbi:MAG TPA: Ku protein [Tepidisphaeraceae bacterium]|nr:Ku protein [Tepidisphaeraceae bacterium]
MASARSVWKGFLHFSLVTVPVRAYTATQSGGSDRIAFNQLHKDCNSRINYKKVCPLHGEVPAHEIVKGYEFAKDQYVIIDEQEISKARLKNEKTVGIESFVPAGSIDPAYYDGTTYYLLPEGPLAAKPYALLRKVMLDTGRVAFATRVSGGHDQTVLVRPAGLILAITVLSLDAAVRKPGEFAAEAPAVDVTGDEVKLARTLVDAMAADEVDLSTYTDRYTESVRQVVEAKLQGRQTIEANVTADEPPAVINLMEALQKSLDETKRRVGQKPPKLVAPSTAGRVAAEKKGRKKA